MRESDIPPPHPPPSPPFSFNVTDNYPKINRIITTSYLFNGNKYIFLGSLYIYPRSTHWLTHWLTDSMTHWINESLICPHNALKTWQNHTLVKLLHMYNVSGSKSPGQRFLEATTWIMSTWSCHCANLLRVSF